MDNIETDNLSIFGLFKTKLYDVLSERAPLFLL